MKRTVAIYRYSIISMLATIFQRLSVILIFGRGFSTQCPIDMEIYITVSAVSSQKYQC